MERDAEAPPLGVLAAFDLGERELLLDDPLLDVKNGPGVEIELQQKILRHLRLYLLKGKSSITLSPQYHSDKRPE